MAGNPKARAAMKLARSAGVSLKEAWRRVKGGASRTVRKVRKAGGKARRSYARAAAKGGKRMGAPGDIVGGMIKKGFKIASNPWKVGGLLIVAAEYDLLNAYTRISNGATTWGDEAQAMATRLPFGAASGSATGTGSRFWNVVLGNAGLYAGRKLFHAFFR